ncbi:efflux RND transporter permease subunit [Pantoea ananatis]
MSGFLYRPPNFRLGFWLFLCRLCGYAFAIISLPVEQYPDLAPPNVRITATYPGASAQAAQTIPSLRLSNRT